MCVCVCHLLDQSITVKAALIAECIDGYIFDCGGISFTAEREENTIIDDSEDIDNDNPDEDKFNRMQIGNGNN